jgi:hypothetical protein
MVTSAARLEISTVSLRPVLLLGVIRLSQEPAVVGPLVSWLLGQTILKLEQLRSLLVA